MQVYALCDTKYAEEKQRKNTVQLVQECFCL